MNPTRHLLLGLLFLGSIGILAAYTVFGTNFDPFGKAKEFTVLFPAAKNLREGDSVLVAGMRVGSVKSLEFQPTAPPDDRIKVVVKIETPVALHEDYEIVIEDATLLGGRNVLIEPGTPDSPLLSASAELRGHLASNPLESLKQIGDVVAENRGAFKSIVDNLNAVVSDVEAGRGTIGLLLRDDEMASNLSASLTDLRASLANVSAISTELRTGQGLIARLVNDPVLGDDFAKILLDISEVVGSLSAGEGLLGRILSPNDPMADGVARLVANVEQITGKINDGTGTLGSLINDPSISRDLGKVLNDLAEGRGSLGALLSSDELYQGFLRLTENLSDVSSALRESRGTLGKLIMEPELYDELLSTVGILNRSLEDFREAAPISTFTSVLFGAF